MIDVARIKEIRESNVGGLRAVDWAGREVEALRVIYAEYVQAGRVEAWDRSLADSGGRSLMHARGHIAWARGEIRVCRRSCDAFERSREAVDEESLAASENMARKARKSLCMMLAHARIAVARLTKSPDALKGVAVRGWETDMIVGSQLHFFCIIGNTYYNEGTGEAVPLTLRLTEKVFSQLSPILASYKAIYQELHGVTLTIEKEGDHAAQGTLTTAAAGG